LTCFFRDSTAFCFLVNSLFESELLTFSFVAFPALERVFLKLRRFFTFVKKACYQVFGNNVEHEEEYYWNGGSKKVRQKQTIKKKSDKDLLFFDKPDQKRHIQTEQLRQNGPDSFLKVHKLYLKNLVKKKKNSQNYFLTI